MEGNWKEKFSWFLREELEKFFGFFRFSVIKRWLLSGDLTFFLNFSFFCQFANKGKWRSFKNFIKTSEERAKALKTPNNFEKSIDFRANSSQNFQFSSEFSKIYPKRHSIVPQTVLLQSKDKKKRTLNVPDTNSPKA